ncbi:DUF3397 domain-containing protein [Thalassobacillus pellis]|uniref:DUF3397 domain-containing protein n=1 Tax=Thalassobacillus pellis TaxID=748008 RepID=UPI001961600A|nr:DUF3397 domain-containing protein [Thalassobacillus pellis]MBM7552862.1 putative membrane protein [Thalassobacillus pellis]
MGEFLIYLYAGIVTMPLPVIAIIYFFTRKFYKYKWKAIHKTTNIATFLFIVAVDLLLLVLFDHSFFGWIILTLLFILVGAVLVQYRLHEEIVIKRVIKGFWRFSCLLFGFAYIGLTLYGLTAKLLEL